MSVGIELGVLVSNTVLDVAIRSSEMSVIWYELTILSDAANIEAHGKGYLIYVVFQGPVVLYSVAHRMQDAGWPIERA